MRRCVRCGEIKTFDEFAWRRKALGPRDNYIAKGLRDRSWDALIDEIATCDVVCANYVEGSPAP
jgi:hypothetical protein